MTKFCCPGCAQQNYPRSQNSKTSSSLNHSVPSRFHWRPSNRVTVSLILVSIIHLCICVVCLLHGSQNEKIIASPSHGHFWSQFRFGLCPPLPSFEPFPTDSQHIIVHVCVHKLCGCFLQARNQQEAPFSQNLVTSCFDLLYSLCSAITRVPFRIVLKIYILCFSSIHGIIMRTEFHGASQSTSCPNFRFAHMRITANHRSNQTMTQ